MKKTKIKKEIKTNKKDWKKMLVDLEGKLNLYFGEKAPQLPESIREFIVKFGPYLMAVGLLFSLPVILASVGLGTVLAPVMFLGSGVRYGWHFSFWSLFGLAIFVLQIMALPGLFKRKMNSWKLMFYASLLSALSSLLNLSLGSLIIGSAISWYFLFQIRKYYK